MPKSFRSFDDGASGADGPADTDDASHVERGSDDEQDAAHESRTPQSPLWMRRQRGKAHFADENSSLLGHMDHSRNYQTRNMSTPGTPRTLRTPGIRRQHSQTSTFRHHTRRGSSGHGFSTRLVNALMRQHEDMETSGRLSGTVERTRTARR